MEKVMERFKKPIAYAVWSTNDEIRFNSTSGGVFSEFASIVIANHGLVAGAQYNKENLVEHALVDSRDGVEKLRQSKYLSSSIGNIYKMIKHCLKNGQTVAFCGSPCQVAGLYSFLGSDNNNLFTMDFICRGTNSPKAFKAWLSEIEDSEGQKINKVWFKYKEGGWKTSPRRTRVDFDNGDYRVFEGQYNSYMNGYLNSNLYIRPCCGNCCFKGAPRKSDVTFADFWGVDKSLDDDKGTSLLLINSKKGKEYFNKIKENVFFTEVSFESIYVGNPMYSKSVKISPKAHSFLLGLDSMTFSEAIKRFTPKKTIWRRLKIKAMNIIKRALQRNGK